jgi:hypothetical protein
MLAIVKNHDYSMLAIVKNHDNSMLAIVNNHDYSMLAIVKNHDYSDTKKKKRMYTHCNLDYWYLYQASKR